MTTPYSRKGGNEIRDPPSEDDSKEKRGMAPRGYNKNLIVCLIVIGLLVLYLASSYSSIWRSNKDNELSWTSFSYGTPPNDIVQRAKSVEIKGNKVKLSVDGKKFELFYRTAEPVKQDETKVPVLFFHGASFTSKTWQDLGTMGLLAAMGHRVVAVDLPGFGSTTSSPGFKRTEFVKEIIKATNIRSPPIIVLPSMAGGFALPNIMVEPDKAHKMISGIIAIAPVGTKDYTHAQYHRILVPTMIIRGERDKGLGLQALSNLQNTHSNVNFVMKKCGHAAYMNDPNKWHELLYNYMIGVQRLYQVRGY